MDDQFEIRYRALRSRDRRFDGHFFVAVTSTGVYCRPSCPAITPKRKNIRFYPTAAAAQGAGFRACLRCRPHAAPGSPEWNLRGDTAARAIGLIADGVVDREGVSGLARRLAYSERHLRRQLYAELGAGPLALARAQRAQTARLLIETSQLALIEVAYAAGFSSVRQFNDTIKATHGRTPSQLRSKAPAREPASPGTMNLRLAYRPPFDWERMLEFFRARAVNGVEEVVDGVYRRTLRLPRAHAVLELSHEQGHVSCALRLGDLRDLAPAVQRARRLLDLDADPIAPAAHLSKDALLESLVAALPGLRVPGTVDGDELAIRAVLGQQVSVAAARTAAADLSARLGDPLPAADGGLTHLFPSAAAIANGGQRALRGPIRRQRTLLSLAEALASGEIAIDPGSDRAQLRSQLLEIPGIGDWTAEYIAMRALADPDAFPGSDLGVRRALERLGGPTVTREILEAAEAWRPWRAYALMHLWASESPPAKGKAATGTAIGAR
jgi:AraC family transcriptional regulator of adaptative response / DNA-3-methyladenine glycosylase II